MRVPSAACCQELLSQVFRAKLDVFPCFLSERVADILLGDVVVQECSPPHAEGPVPLPGEGALY